jgi:hypothetical protein
MRDTRVEKSTQKKTLSRQNEEKEIGPSPMAQAIDIYTQAQNALFTRKPRTCWA